MPRRSSIYFFAYLTHKPHEVHERYRDTNVFWVKGKTFEPIVNWLYMFQNFHLIHHLFPRVPFYLYPNAFRSLKPVLEKSTPTSTNSGSRADACMFRSPASQVLDGAVATFVFISLLFPRL